MNSIAKTRIKKELQMFINSPTPGISCSSNENSLQSLTGVIFGAPETPFENGIFSLDIQIPERYPFEPPCVRFITPIYHPNIDSKGRICLDTLKPPPQGTWKPILNLSSVLMMVRILLGEPGTEDPLMADIWQEYKYDYPTYAQKARLWTERYARGDCGLGSNSKMVPSTNTKRTNPANGLNKDVPHPDMSDRDTDSGNDSHCYSVELKAASISSVLHDGTNLQKVPKKRQLGLKSSKEGEAASGSSLGETGNGNKKYKLKDL